MWDCFIINTFPITNKGMCEARPFQVGHDLYVCLSGFREEHSCRIIISASANKARVSFIFKDVRLDLNGISMRYEANREQCEEWKSVNRSGHLVPDWRRRGSVAEVGAAAVGDHTLCFDVALTHGHVHALTERVGWERKQRDFMRDAFTFPHQPTLGNEGL